MEETLKLTFSVESVKKQLEIKKSTFIGFWGHSSNQPKDCFSNFYKCAFTVHFEGEESPTQFTCTEQFMMYSKAIHFKDLETAKEILETPYSNPKIYKDLGRKVKGFSEKEWNRVRNYVVYSGCLAKFEQNPSLKNILLNTKEAILVEASPYDRIWGIGLSVKDKDWLSIDKWKGLNLLGFILMEVRKELISHDKLFRE